MTTEYTLQPRNRCAPVEIVSGPLPMVFRVEVLEHRVEVALYARHNDNEPTSTETVGEDREGETANLMRHFHASRATMRTHADNFGARVRVTF